MLEILHREAVYLWYYFQLQLSQIFRYWVLEMVLGSAVSVFAKERSRCLSGHSRGPATPPRRPGRRSRA